MKFVFSCVQDEVIRVSDSQRKRIEDARDAFHMEVLAVIKQLRQANDISIEQANNLDIPEVGESIGLEGYFVINS